MEQYRKSALLVLVLLALTVNLCSAADSYDLLKAYFQMYDSRLDTSTTSSVENLLITHQDMSLQIDSGRIAFFKPLIIDSTEYIYGAYFEGMGDFSFFPQLENQKTRALHYFDSEILDLKFKKIFMLFSDEIYRQIAGQVSPAKQPFTNHHNRAVRASMNRLTQHENFYFIFETLRSLINPPERPFLLANIQWNSYSQSHYYLYNSMSCEEVRLYKNKIEGPNFAQYMRALCCYSYCNINAPISGEVASPQIEITHYKIDAQIDSDGKLWATTKATFKVLRPPAQLIWMNLHNDLRVTEIIDEDGSPVQYLRYENPSNKSVDLYLVLDRLGNEGDAFNLTFQYEGLVAERGPRLMNNEIVDNFRVTAGAEWYPTYVDRDESTFDITYRTPNDDGITFSSDGELFDRREVADTIITHWKINKPSFAVFFDIRYE